MAPEALPIGLRLSQSARVVSRSFDEALQQAGGSLPVWLILLNLKIRRPDNQRELAEAVGIREATLTHHLNTMDARGLLTRRRDEANRRIHVVELTTAGDELFQNLQQAAVAFDTQLRDGLPEQDLAALDAMLVQLMANAGGAREDAMPWAGLPRDLPRPAAGRLPAAGDTHPRSTGPPGQRRLAAHRAILDRRVSRPGGRAVPAGAVRKVRTPQGRVVGNADPG